MAILANTGLYGFIASCKKEAKKYKEYFESGFKGHGWKIWEYKSGKYKLETDEVAVRKQLRSCDYDEAASDMERKGFLIETDYTISGTELAGYSRAEFDEIFVRKRAVFKEIVIEQLNSIAGGLVISAAHGKIAAAKNAVYQNNASCFVVLEDGSESPGKAPNSSTGNPNASGDPYDSNNPNGSTPYDSSENTIGKTIVKSAGFIRGDMVLCQRADYDETEHSFELKRYWMLVEKSGLTSDSDCPLPAELKEAGKQYIVLSFKHRELSGNSNPAQGDALVQFGYIPEYGDLTIATDIKDRQRAITISQLMDSHGAFVEYQNLGNTKPYFEVRSSHVVTRICGKGNNKFTGEFVISSGGGTVNLKDYVDLSKEEAEKGAIEQAKNAISTVETALKESILGVENNFGELQVGVEDVLAGLEIYMNNNFDSIKATHVTKTDFKVLDDQVTSQVTEITAIGGKVEASESKISQLANKIESTVTRIDNHDNAISAARSDISQLADEIDLNVKKAIIDQSGKINQLESDLKLLPGSISATVKGQIGEEYKEAGLEIKVVKDQSGKILEGHIEMQADKVKILNGSTTAALFEDGKLNTELIDTNNLIVRGSIAEVPHPLDPGDMGNDVYLNFENGFNYAGRNNYNTSDRYIFLPDGIEYNGIRCTIINTGDKPSDGPLILGIKNETGSTNGEFFTNRELRTCLQGLGNNDVPGIGQVRIDKGGVIHLYAFWHERQNETVNENGETVWTDASCLKWYIENLDSFSISTDATKSLKELALRTYSPANRMALICSLSGRVHMGATSVSSCTISDSPGPLWNLLDNAPTYHASKELNTGKIRVAFSKRRFQRYVVCPVVSGNSAVIYAANQSPESFEVIVSFNSGVSDTDITFQIYVLECGL